MTQCTARAKRTGEQCRAQAVVGRTVCRVHGGMTPRGHALPQTTHGRYSKDLPTRLLADYEAARTDPDLIAVREELAVAKARGAELLRAIADAGNDPRRVAALWTEFFAVVDVVRALSETERRRIEAAHRVLTAEQVMLLIGALLDAVRRHVDDRKVCDAIGREFGKLVGEGEGGHRGRADDPA